ASILLHGSTYLTDYTGASSQPWSPAQTILILSGLAAALALVWTLMILLIRRAPDWSIPFAVALTCAGAGVTIMLSGYATGGQIGLAVLASMAGTLLASLILPARAALEGPLGISVVALFALLIMGRFFGELPTSYATMLWAAPLLCWLAELPAIH